MAYPVAKSSEPVVSYAFMSYNTEQSSIGESGFKFNSFNVFQIYWEEGLEYSCFSLMQTIVSPLPPGCGVSGSAPRSSRERSGWSGIVLGPVLVIPRLGTLFS